MWKFISSFWSDHIRTNQFNSLLRFGVNFLIGVLLINSYLTQDEVGMLEYGLFLAFTGSFIFTFAYSSSILTRIKYQDTQSKEDFNDVFWQLFFISIVTSAGLYGLLNLLPSFGVDFMPNAFFIPISVLAGLIILVIPAELFYIIHQRAKSFFTYSLSIHLGLLALVLIGVYMKWDILSILYIYIFINLIKLLVVLFQIKPRFAIKRKVQKEWFVFTIPLFLHFVLGSSMDYLDGHIVASYLDENKFLFYRYGARELPFSMILLNAISASFIPILTKDINGLGEMKQRIKRIMHFVFPLSIVLMFVSPFLFQTFYGEDFILSAQVFNFYLLIVSSRILLPHTILYAKQDNRALLIFSAIEFVINVVLSISLISVMGITGVAFATVIAFLVNRILSIFYIKRKYEIGLDAYLPKTAYLFYMTLMVGCFLIVQFFLYE